MERDYFGTKRITAWPEEKDGKPGYGVRYQPDGYVSWSPADVFEAAYQPLDAMSFGHALMALKDGLAVARSGWRYHWLIKDGVTIMDHRLDGSFDYRPSSEDQLADDWQVLPSQVGA